MTNIIKLNIFGHIYEYDFSYPLCPGFRKAEYDIEVFEKLRKKIDEPQILSSEGYPFNCITFCLKDLHEHPISNDFLDWLISNEIPKLKPETKNENYISRILSVSTVDEEWTKERNSEYNRTVYTKISFNDDIKKIVKDKIDEYISQLKKILTEEEDKKKKMEEKLQEESKQWKKIRTYSEELPKGGENGRDGYIDADYQSINGEIIRFVCRNVFDVGRYNYPKRVEGTKDVLDSSNWTAAEQDLSGWLCKFGLFGTFGKYRGFRM